MGRRLIIAAYNIVIYLPPLAPDARPFLASGSKTSNTDFYQSRTHRRKKGGKLSFK